MLSRQNAANRRDFPSTASAKIDRENLQASENAREEVEARRGTSRRLFLFSSNFLDGTERKVALKGISTLYRSAYLSHSSSTAFLPVACLKLATTRESAAR